MEELKESFENQLIYLYDEKTHFENQLGFSDPKEIVSKFKELENELNYLYGIKERYRKVPSTELKITSIKNVFVEKSRLKGSL
ncbi:hypothetical protein EHQ58_00860 [Leptospira ognonensis]|uniref:Uncharacterized protein n=1 Tax=Leptospira ognonensis TaxID=2484945 RepID=A0A4R9KCV4_9LEPT|nr:hypothetical protein [Leptospira ognonensis]TGL63946.1 hypothetical protein EHQ58_00860 [Leptospira ognonensis]